MSTDEQPGQASGSVPNAYGNALAWRWSREMPASLKRSGMLTLLYAMRSMANANGELRFHGDHRPIRIQDIAKAAGADEKDVRDRMEAAILAGVVVVIGERRRGRAALYALALTAEPNWTAAAAYLTRVRQEREEAKQQRASKRKAAPWADNSADEFGGRAPEVEGPEFGGPPPEQPEPTEREVQGAAPRTGSGDRPPIGSGDRPPNNPGSTQEITQEMAEVALQPQVVGARTRPEINSVPAPPRAAPDAEPAAPDFARCARCHHPMIRRPGRDTHAHCAPLAEPRAAS